jgi:hypothetical protein
VTEDGVVTGIAWYRADQWTRLRDVAADPDVLEDSYEDWLVGAQRILVQMAVSGVQVRPVDVDVDALVRWCETEGRLVDSAARAAYAVFELRRAHQGGDR